MKKKFFLISDFFYVKIHTWTTRIRGFRSGGRSRKKRDILQFNDPPPSGQYFNNLVHITICFKHRSATLTINFHHNFQITEWKCSKILLKQFFEWDFFKPQILIEICSFLGSISWKLESGEGMPRFGVTLKCFFSKLIVNTKCQNWSMFKKNCYITIFNNDGSKMEISWH